VSPGPGEKELVLGWLADPGSSLVVRAAGHERALSSAGGGCLRSSLFAMAVPDGARIRFRTSNALVLDYLELSQPESKKR
jgi:hypothetical protein